MATPLDNQGMLDRIPVAVAELLAVLERDVHVSVQGTNVRVEVLGQRFGIGMSGDSGPGPVSACAARIVNAVAREDAIPVVVTPFMSASGRRICEQEGVSWFDLSGNARIIAPGLRTIIDGRPNAFPKRGRPMSLFAPKSSRISRWLLMHPTEAFTQRALVEATGLSKGLVSRIATRLHEQRYVVRKDDGRISLSKRGLLLDAWWDEYRFSKHNIHRGHVAARSGDALMRAVADTLSTARLEHAATGLCAAWQFTHFSGFRIATFLVTSQAPKLLGDRLGFREDERGANLWLVVPNDKGAFDGVEDQDGIRCVHPVQAFLDLKGHPERAAEAAERLRAEQLNFEALPS